MALQQLLSQDAVDIVFSGTVGAVQRSGVTEAVTFDVDRVWKGSVNTYITIYGRIPAPNGEPLNPTLFDRDKRYVVIAHRLTAAERADLGLWVTEAYGTDSCASGSRLFSSVQDDINVIGPGRAPPVPAPAIAQNSAVRKIRDVRPLWPAAARGSDIRGTVIVEFMVDTDGTVKNARVVRSIPLLDEAVLDCVRQWLFDPGRVDGRAVPTLVTAAVPFR